MTSLIYSDGISDKDISSGGSYGIGKCNIRLFEIQNCFYSTLDIDNKSSKVYQSLYLIRMKMESFLKTSDITETIKSLFMIY